MTGEFVSLHTHTEYSVLDGAAKLEDMAKHLKKIGQKAVAQTDHGQMHGAYEFWKTMTKADIKPILGMEAYMAPTNVARKEAVYLGPEDMRRHDVGGRGAYTHISLLAKNATGLRNLFKLHGLSYASDMFYYKPRIDFNALSSHSEGLIVLSGCAGSRISTHLRLGQYAEAVQHARDLKAIFGDDFYVEVMSHGITETWSEEGNLVDGFDEARLNDLLMQVAEDIDSPLVATNDSHYTKDGDCEVHDALLCVQTRARVSDANRFRFSGAGYHLKTYQEMLETGLPVAAIDQSAILSDGVGDYAEVFEHKLMMPGWDKPQTLRDLVYASTRFNNTSEYNQRLETELAVIEESGFQDYFLVLADVIGWAKKNGIIVGPGRGSAGGSLVSFAVGITDIDPIAHGLLFERFLNPERVSLPDVDVDIDDRERDRLLAWLQERHGVDKVAQIMTLGTIGAKAALKDATRVFGYPYAMGEELVSYLPAALFGAQTPLSKMPAVEGPERKAVVRLAHGLEGLIRNVGVHAAGVVVSPVPLQEVMPTWRQPTRGDMLLTGWDADPTQALGLVKMDFLGLRNLGVIKDTLNYIGKDYDWLLGLPLDDIGVYRLLTEGCSEGVFQLDSDGMKRLLKGVKPESFADIAAVLALYRPGPMGAKSHDQYAIRKNKRGVSRGPAIHPELDSAIEPLLRETYGLIVYQEQVMAVLQRLCGWSLGKADIVRKAMGKKDHAVLESVRPDFFESLDRNGYSWDAADALWEVLMPFADYAFNKSHSVGYGLVSYWTAYLKVNYPAEYMTALLTSVAEDPKRLPGYLEEARRMGLRMLPPDVNISGEGFTPDHGAIRYGLKAIKGFGEGAFKALDKGRPFKDVNDFYTRAPAAVLNVGVLHSLIRSGALDSIQPRRIGLDDRAEEMAARASEERKSRSSGRRSLFRKSYDALSDAIEDAQQYIEWETEYLGIAVTALKVVVTLKRSLDEAEWDYLSDLLVSCPGSSSVVLRFEGVDLHTEYAVDTDAIRARIGLLTMLDWNTN